MTNKRVVILGAGLAGLSAAWHLKKNGIDSFIFEKESEVGGLCRTREINGFSFDCDGHLLHFKNPYTFSLVKDLLGKNLIRHKRQAGIFYQGCYIPFPFQANLYRLPLKIRRECLAGFIQAQEISKGNTIIANFQDWIYATFGQGMARHFFIPYNQKFWTVPLDELTCEWLDGFIPVPDLKQVIEGAKRKSSGKFGYNAEFWYPRYGGIQVLPFALAKDLSHIYTGCPVEKINLRNRTVITSNKDKIRYDYLIYTAPLPELRNMLIGSSSEVNSSFSLLRWNSIFNLNLGIKSKMSSKKHWIYFPDKEFEFFRLGFYSSFSPCAAPSGAYSVYTEVSLSGLQDFDSSLLVKKIKQDLIRLGILPSPDDVLVEHRNFMPYAYPIYDKNHRLITSKIANYLRKYNIFLCGRFGSWQYLSMEGAILQGKQIARELA